MGTLRSVLIANRGEIALRILRTCKVLGIEPVCIFAPIDRHELYVRFASRAYPLTGDTPVSCYLDIDQIVWVAKKAGCDALHPGYGFLSEQAAFARAVEKAGICFIGPTPETMEVMGDKIEARKVAKAAGVPLIPGTLEPVEREKVVKEAEKVGFPLMLKAQGGGGGKGIRIVEKREDLLDAFDRATSEAKASFGIGGLYLEKVIEKCRHVEVQILGDGKGNVVALGERDCTLQRRHQKIVEESPCPFISESLRRELHEAAVRIGKEVNYRSAGTVEFLVEPEKERFYFLEMNTRLQVEHPVTEMVFALDLVELQFQIAQGKGELPQGLLPRGHSLEIRVVAEDPYGGFLPSTGEITYLHLPSGPGVRLDSALYEGQKITPYFDPMLAKLILFGKNRKKVLLRARQALEEFHILGVSNNLSYVLSLLEDPRIERGEYHTRFLEEEFSPPVPENGVVAAMAAGLAAFLKEEEKTLAQEEKEKKVNYWKFLGRVERLRKW